MKFQLTTFHWLILSKIAVVLLFFFTIGHHGSTQFLLLLSLFSLFVLRIRVPRLHPIIYGEAMLCVVFMMAGNAPPYFLLVVLFEAVVQKKVLVLLGLITLYEQPEYWMLAAVTLLAAHFLSRLESAQQDDFLQQARLRSQVQELNLLNDDLALSLQKDVHQAAVNERFRISREIHDNAGHDIIAAYIAFQTLGDLIENDEVKGMFDDTLTRLSDGVGKIRNILHNLTPAEVSSVARLEKICADYPLAVDFKFYGNAEVVPVYVWSVFEVCLKEALTNVSRHSTAKQVNVQLTVAPQIIRLYVENDGVTNKKTPVGRGLSNLRYRVNNIGGNLSTTISEGKFMLIGIVPLKSNDISVIGGFSND